MNETRTEGSSLVQVGGLRWRVRKSDLGKTCAPILADPESFLQNPSLYFKDSKVVTISKIAANEHAPRLVLRRLNYGKWWHRLKDFFRPSRVQRAFRNAVALEQAGIATARAVAAADVRCYRWPITAYLISEEIVHAKTLAQYVSESRELSRLMVQRLAELLAHLHQSGFSHRDLKFTNVLVDDQLRPYLIDLDGVHRMSPSSIRRAALDLSRFAREVTGRPELLRRWGSRFLILYCSKRDGQMLRPLRARILKELGLPEGNS